MNITRRTFTAALSLAGASAALGLSPWQFFSPASAQTAAEINQAGELGDMALGSKDAPVTIIEYASMTCPHCAAFTKDVFPQIKTNYIDTGKVRFIFREFPLDQVALAASALCHGDLCATNILWEHGAGGPTARYIDFEWAQGDDPARDLAILGGAVHGGPWYVPLAEEQVAAFVEEYVRARGELGEVPAGIADVGALRERMRAWTAYERTAMLVHVASRAATRASHRQVLPVLQGTLAAELGLDG